MKVEVRPGYIRLNTVVGYHLDQNFKIFEVDASTKYYELFAVSSDFDEDSRTTTVIVWLDKGERTLRWDEDADDLTAVKITGLEGDHWRPTVECTRYTCHISLARFPPELEGVLLWNGERDLPKVGRPLTPLEGSS